jgi:type I restriction enzyme, R subunit
VITSINSEDRLIQKTFADYLETELGWDNVYGFNTETFGPHGTLGRSSEREVVLQRDLRERLGLLNADLPAGAVEQAIEKLTRFDFSRSLLQHNRERYRFIRDGVPVEWRDDDGELQHAHAKVIDFQVPDNNRFLTVRELKIQGLRVPHYNRRADLVCFVNGLPLVFIELKAVYLNMRAGFDNNLTDYLHESSISHAFHHNAFLVVSNGDRARYGSITSRWEHFAEWKRNDERDDGRVDAEILLRGMLDPPKLLDLVENFVAFDDSRPGGTRKIVARNHQVLGVNNAVASVDQQEELKRLFPADERVRHRTVERARVERNLIAPASESFMESLPVPAREGELPIIERAHPDLGRLGVFWHTQGSGKSYSMVFFSEKVRRVVPGNFTFLIITDREDLDEQIWRTFVGCGIADEQTPRASSGDELRRLLGENHRFIFTLIHKFNQPVASAYSLRDDIIVMSDEAHRTQAGRFARNMRLALPNASFIGFTGTPLFKQDELTRRIFGDYVSRYDFQRSQEDRSTVKLVYESRGEKLGIARMDLNERIAEAIEEAELDDNQTSLLERLLGQDYEVITADDRIDKLAADFVEYCTTRWQTGKSMLVCIDKVTCARMLMRIRPRWEAKQVELGKQLELLELERAASVDPDRLEHLATSIDELRGRVEWMASTIIELIISEAQNEVRDFEKWGFDIIPHRAMMKTGFETPDGRRVHVDDAFKDPDHPFRVAIVCAMWLTGFDVESLATLYIDKPMKAHTLMQAIARANRVYPGKDYGVIVDYNGMLKSLQSALAQYALGDGGAGGSAGTLVAPLEELVAALVDAIEEAEAHLRSLGFDPGRLEGATGFARIAALRDAVDALHTSDDAKRRFEAIARHVFARFKALLMEPAALVYAERHDNIETIFKKLQELRDTADVTDVLKELHRIVNDAIRAEGADAGDADGARFDLSEIDFERLRNEFARHVKRKRLVIHDIREAVEAKLQQMMAVNPTRMDYYRRYEEIIADYNREKERATVEATFAELITLAESLDAEQRRAATEGLSDEELAVFDLLYKEDLTTAEREQLKQASRSLLPAVRATIAPMADWTRNVATQAEVKVLILDDLWSALPRPPFSDHETEELAERVYEYVWQRSVQDAAIAA